MIGTVLQLERIRRLANDYRIPMNEIRVWRDTFGGKPNGNIMVSWPNGRGNWYSGLIEKDGRMHT